VNVTKEIKPVKIHSKAFGHCRLTSSYDSKIETANVIDFYSTQSYQNLKQLTYFTCPQITHNATSPVKLLTQQLSTWTLIEGLSHLLTVVGMIEVIHRLAKQFLWLVAKYHCHPTIISCYGCRLITVNATINAEYINRD